VVFRALRDFVVIFPTVNAKTKSGDIVADISRSLVLIRAGSWSRE
jgi:hypothetical protein